MQIADAISSANFLIPDVSVKNSVATRANRSIRGAQHGKSDPGDFSLEYGMRGGTSRIDSSVMSMFRREHAEHSFDVVQIWDGLAEVGLEFVYEPTSSRRFVISAVTTLEGPSPA